MEDGEEGGKEHNALCFNACNVAQVGWILKSATVLGRCIYLTCTRVCATYPDGQCDSASYNRCALDGKAKAAHPKPPQRSIFRFSRLFETDRFERGKVSSTKGDRVHVC